MNAAQNFGNKGKEKWFCTHCKRTNHTIDKCYQLHGFSPGFGRERGRGFVTDSNAQQSVNNVAGTQYSSDTSTPNSSTSTFVQPPLSSQSPSLTADQCQQLLVYLQSQLQEHSISHETPFNQAPAHTIDNTPFFSGMFTLNSFVAFVVKSYSVWFIDTGATHHVCCNSSLFVDKTPVHNVFTLPDSAKVPIHKCWFCSSHFFAQT